MTKVRDILGNKGSRVVFVGPDLTLRQALETMVDNKVGALPVKDTSGDIVGIITERDLMREVHGRADLETSKISDVMTKNIISARKDDGIDMVMEQMTVNRFRHVPIVEGGKLVGIISIGDLVKSQLAYLKHQMEDLRDYVSGNAA
jgi:CBS domain-containing protein